MQTPVADADVIETVEPETVQPAVDPLTTANVIEAPVEEEA